MAKADETKRNPSSDLDDDIFAILNSTRPTYPGGGPNEQKPATQLNRRAVSQPNQPTQPQTNAGSSASVQPDRCSAAGTAARSAATASAGDFSRCHGR